MATSDSYSDPQACPNCGAVCVEEPPITERICAFAAENGMVGQVYRCRGCGRTWSQSETRPVTLRLAER